MGGEKFLGSLAPLVTGLEPLLYRLCSRKKRLAISF